MLAPGWPPPKGVSGSELLLNTIDHKGPQMPPSRATPIPVSNPIGLT